MHGCESWTIKNTECQITWCSWTVVLEKTLESPLNCKEIKPVNPKGDQPWIFIGKTDAEAEGPILWPPDAKKWLIGKDPDVGKEWRQEEKGMTEVRVVGWHHRLDGHEFEQAPGVGDGQGGLLCCNPWGRKESDTTEWLNWIELNIKAEGPGRDKAQVKLPQEVGKPTVSVDNLRTVWDLVVPSK